MHSISRCIHVVHFASCDFRRPLRHKGFIRSKSAVAFACHVGALKLQHLHWCRGAVLVRSSWPMSWKPSMADTRGEPQSTGSTTHSKSDSGWDWSAGGYEEAEHRWDDGADLVEEAQYDGGQDPWWDASQKDPWSRSQDGWMDDAQLRNFHVARLPNTTAFTEGRWTGSYEPNTNDYAWTGSSWQEDDRDRKPTEKINVPEFDGEPSSEGDLGKTARSYVRKVQVWLRCTRMAPSQRGLALYNALKGRAWVYAEELDMDLLASEKGVSYFLEWVQTRFMDMEISKISQLMDDLFRKCKRKHDQGIRDFNVEFERMILRLKEIKCDLPPILKAWLYMDKLRLSDSEELALLSSVNNEYDCRKLQQAALLQDRTLRRNNQVGDTGGKGKGKRWSRHTVHMTATADGDDGGSSGDDDKYEVPEDEEEILDETTAVQQHTAYMAYQGAKAKYKEVVKGRGVDQDALERRNQERLRLAKQRSYCSVCKRRGHWHKDPECPMFGQSKDADTKEAYTVNAVQMCDVVHTCYLTADEEGTIPNDDKGISVAYITSTEEAMLLEEDPGIRAILDTACTRTVASYKWFESYVALADRLGLDVCTANETQLFRFGASKVFTSTFALKAWFGIHGRHFMVRVSIVPCDVPLLFSRPVLGALGACYDVGKQLVSLETLGLKDLPLITSQTGHPALLVSDFGDCLPSKSWADISEDDICVVDGVYKCAMTTSTTLVYPKKLSREVELLLQDERLLGGNSFMCWWKGANQTKDFWMETDQEFIRVHVVPRKHPFNPALWNTKLTALRDSLIGQLSGERITECVPCLADGVVMKSWKDENYHTKTPNTDGMVGPWVGRSRFVKSKTQARSCPNSADANLSTAVAMDHEEGRPLGRAGGDGCPSASRLDCSGIASDSDRAAGSLQASEARANCSGTVQDVLEGSDRDLREAEHHTTPETNPRTADEDDSGCQHSARSDPGHLREVQGLDVLRGAGGVPAMECGRGGQECGSFRRSEEAGDLGQDEAGARAIYDFPESNGCGSGSGGGDPSTYHQEHEGHVSRQRIFGQLLERGEHAQPQEQPGLPAPASANQRRRAGRRNRCAHRGGEVGESSGSSEEAPGKVKAGMTSTGSSEDDVSVPAADMKMRYGNLPDEGAMRDFDNSERDVGKYDNIDAEVDANEYLTEELGGKDYEGVGDTRSIDAKIRAGNRRRRLARQTNFQKVKRQAGQIFEAMMACSMMLGSWTHEVLGEPIWDAWAVMQPRHQHAAVHSEVDCLELFAGDARLSSAFAKKHRGVLQPRDLRFNHDLRKVDVQDEVVDEIWRERPKLVWLAPPCTKWCRFSKLNYEPQELRRLRKKEEGLVQFVSRVYDLQNTLGGIAVVENPQTSDLWRHPALQKYVGITGMFADLDMCRFGLKSSVDGMPLRKGISLLTNNATFAADLALKCLGTHEEHRPIQGKDTAWSASYPAPFGTAVVKAVDKAWGKNHIQISENFPVDLYGEEPRLLGAEAISFKGKVNPVMASTLKRIHQNLGHPPNKVLVKHLRIGGASPAIIRAAEQMVCRTCERSSKVKPARVSQPCVALDFNEAIAADVIWLDTVQTKNYPALNVVDLASTYQVVLPLESTKSEELGRALVDGWMSWAGAPKHLLVDLDSGFKDKFLQLMDQRNVTVRCAAGQAHWQNGVCERHGAAWKSIWEKLVDEEHILDSELEEAIACVSDAKNQLRNKSGYSPRQWVFGTQMRMTGDLFDDDAGVGEWNHMTACEKAGRSQVIRMGARAAFFKCQTKDALARAVNHRARVEPQSYEPGDMVYIHRNVSQGKGQKPIRTWLGPATIIGREGQNYWAARGGRCLLVAPEHLRTAHHEEVSETLRLKISMLGLKKLMEAEDDSIMDDELDGVDEQPAVEDLPARDRAGHIEMEVENEELERALKREEEIGAFARRRQALDDLPVSMKKLKTPFGAHSVHMVKHAISQRGQEKQLEKELPWQLIPPEERELYREAERKQWLEHVEYGAVRALSLDESERVRKEISPERILSSRFLYRDKNFAKRKLDSSVPPKAKARLCIAGQHDPDLGKVDMSTDAPTVSRHSIIMALQLALCRGWRVSVGDIRAAFLNGIPAPRKLYFRQPKRGMPGLEPGQLIEILKGVFGLSTSPKLWWMKLSGDLTQMKIAFKGETFDVVQNVIDPCCFQFIHQKTGDVRGLLLTHVDDLMLMADSDFSKYLQVKLKEMFPVDEWENDKFDYVGCEYECMPDKVHITQKLYTGSRVEKIHVPSKTPEDQEATPEQMEENRTAIGCLSWLAKQTRPDIQFQVCQAQRKQRSPTVRDLKDTNKAIDDAMRFQGGGLTMHAIPEERVCFLAYHDAAWGNALPAEEDEAAELWNGDHQVGSQLGSLVLLADVRCLTAAGGKFGVVDWKSKSAQRVCRSTFAGETMACSEAMEHSLFLRSLFLSFATGKRVPDSEAGKYIPLHMVTDCRSLFDHIHREGVPRAPAEKRLAIDLAGIRQALVTEAKHQWRQRYGCDLQVTPERPLKPPLHWLPTGEQLADILTKRLKADDWWERVNGGDLALPLREAAERVERN